MQRCPTAARCDAPSDVGSRVLPDVKADAHMVMTDDRGVSLCVEVAVDDGSWVERLPPAPGNGPVSVSFDDVELAARDRTAVTDLGYVVVGTAGVRHAGEVAHLLVPQAVVERHTRWWRALLDLATRVYDLRFGPVQFALADVLRLHADQAPDPTTATPSPLHAPGRRPPTA
jgi:hypothetical protein